MSQEDKDATIKPSDFLVRKEGGIFHITSSHTEIATQKAPLRFEVELKKLPTPVELGANIDNITIDTSPKLEDLKAKARQFATLPERDRVAPLVSLVVSNIQYAYPWVVKNLATINPTLANKVQDKFGLTGIAGPAKLSDSVDLGYGLCKDLTVALLVLAKEAGLQGAYLTYNPDQKDPTSYITNVTRDDNGLPLFQSVEVGKPFLTHHAFGELLIDDNAWIPVDPTTQLVGSSDDRLATFKLAGYQAHLQKHITTQGLPPQVFGEASSSLRFLPGETKTKGDFIIGGKTITIIQRPHNLLEPQRYYGPLDFSLIPTGAKTGTLVEVVNVTPV